MSRDPKIRSLTAILPMRAGSQRVPHKNTKPFSGFEFGLAELKIKQLLSVGLFDQILIDTDEPDIVKIVNKVSKEMDQECDVGVIRISARHAEFATSVTTTDDLIKYLGMKLETDFALWTHVTSPFVSSDIYREAISTYFNLEDAKYDSLMSVSKLQEFIWDSEGPKNYNYKEVKWPRTQTLPPWYFINSGLFVCPTKFYVEKANRIGEQPYLFTINKIAGFDVDWPEDFEMAQALAVVRPDLL